MKIKGKHHHRCIPVTTWSPWAAGDVEHLQRTGSSISDSYADDSIHPPQLQETWHQLDMLQQRQHLMDQVRSLPDPKDGHTCTMAWICANLIQAIWVQLSRTLYGYCPSIVKHEGVLINLAIMRQMLARFKTAQATHGHSWQATLFAKFTSVQCVYGIPAPSTSHVPLEQLIYKLKLSKVNPPTTYRLPRCMMQSALGLVFACIPL